VFVTGGSAQPAPAAGPVRLHRTGRRLFPETSELALDPELRVFIGDMVRPYDRPLREDLLSTGAGQSYARMAEALLPEVVAGEPVDLLVLAFAIHDIRIGQATAVYLSSRCPGGPLAFAICDQGSAAAFTALRLIREYARTGDCRRGLLIVTEQSALHYEPAGPAPVPEVHAAVGLLFEASPPLIAVGSPSPPAGVALTAVAQYADVPAPSVRERLVAALGEVPADPAELVVVLGAGLAELAGELPGKAVTAPAGQPYTGGWWELAGGVPEWAGSGRPVVLADYDHTLRYLCLSTFDTRAPGAV
jgi:hypothetical protein